MIHKQSSTDKLLAQRHELPDLPQLTGLNPFDAGSLMQYNAQQQQWWFQVKTVWERLVQEQSALADKVNKIPTPP